MGGDVDDTALVAFANRLADRGEIVLLAVMHNGNNPWGGAAVSAVNTYYSRPWLPVGTYRTAAEANRPEYHPLVDRSNPNGPRIPLSYVGPSLRGEWPRLLAENFPCVFKSRLEFPDAVDVYRQVLAMAPDDSVVIINGGYLGNLSNLIAWFDVDPQLRDLFHAKVCRKTGAVGGHNTCNNNVFPAGMARHVLNNPVHHTAEMSWLGGPRVDLVATQTRSDLPLRLELANPVREAYRFKTEVEHQRRGSSIAWDWHIIDVLTGFSTVAWNSVRQPNGLRYFDLEQPQWLGVQDNCSATLGGGQGPVPHWDFQGVKLSSQNGQSVPQVSQALRDRFFEQGLYARPLSPWAPERDHLAITAAFADGTFGGLDLLSGHPNVGIVAGKLRAPSSNSIFTSGAHLLTEGRRYQDLTFVTRFDHLPQVGQHPISATSPVQVELYLNVDSRLSTGWGNAPVVRVISWPERGSIVGGSPSAGLPVCRVELWDNTATGYRMLTTKTLRNTAAGQPFLMHVSLEQNAVDCRINGEPAFASPVLLHSQPPGDGGHVQLSMTAKCPNDYFDVPHLLIRPRAGTDVTPDVYFDKAGTVWFSYVTNGDFEQDFLHTEGGTLSHLVEMDLRPRPGWGGQGVNLRFVWDDPNPSVADWTSMLGSMNPEGLGHGYWIYGMRNFPWEIGDNVVLEYRGRREGEQSPMKF